MKRYIFKVDGCEVGEFFHKGEISHNQALAYKREFAKERKISIHGLKIQKGTKYDQGK